MPSLFPGMDPYLEQPNLLVGVLQSFDLLRADEPMAMQGVITPTDYRILVS
jgi:hypothetical protein